MSDLTDVAPSSAGAEELPSLDPYRAGNAGIPYVMSFAASRPGPHVVMTAILHGNEVCGAAALDRLLRSRLRPRQGRLTFVFANVDAYRRQEHDRPAPSRFLEEDMNRLWSPTVLDSRRSSTELRRARAIRPIMDSADYLLDIHSMQHGDPLLLSGSLEKGRRLALELEYPTVVVADRGHAAGVRLRDYGAFGDPARPQNAVLVECGPHDGPDAAAVALATAMRFLAHLGVVRRRDSPLPEAGRRAPAQLIEVTHAVAATSDKFRFATPVSGLERIRKAGTVIAYDDDRPIATPYDDCVLVMPTDPCQPGQTAVRLGRVA